MLGRWISRLLLLLTCAGPAGAVPLVMLVDTSAMLPEALIEQGLVKQGLHLDLGQALARRLGRELQIRAIPRKRIAQELANGQAADLVCDYQPAWLPGPFQWSRAFIPDEVVLITRSADAAPADLAALRGKPIGTVLGFAYPELAAALGAGLVRDDAHDSRANLAKFERGRMRHAVTARRLLEFQQRQGQFQTAIHAPLHVATVMGQCALSARSSVSLAALDAAIQALLTEGEITRILGRYR